MKKIILILIALNSTILFSQAVVSAPILEAKAAEQSLMMKKDVAETIKQSKMLTESYKMAKENVDVFKKISSSLKNLKLLSRIVQNQVELVKTSSEIISIATKIGMTPGDLVMVNDMLQTTLEEGADYVELTQDLMKDDAINGSDTERINILLAIKEIQNRLKQDLGIARQFVSSLKQAYKK